MEPADIPAYTFGAFRLDARTYVLLRDGIPVPLTSKAFDALLLLVQHRDRVVTKEELLATVWRDSVVTDDSLIQAISTLRRALGDDSAQPHFIATVARRGYRFVAPVDAEAVAQGTAAAPASIAEVQPEPVATDGRSFRPVWLFAPAAIAVLLLAGGWWLSASRTGTPSLPAPLRFVQPAPPGTTLASGGVLSPDGRYLVFAAEDEKGLKQLWVRSLDAEAARPMEGTEGATRPLWSPDSQSIAFFSRGRLKTIRLAGGPASELAVVGPRPAGASWGLRGQILFSAWGSGLMAVDTAGGPVRPITMVGGDNGFTHAWPQFLPDGEHFLFFIYGGQQSGAHIGSLSSADRVRILEGQGGAVATYSPDGYLLYPRRGAVMAQPFDARTLEVTGEPFPIATGTAVSPNMTNGTVISAAPGGLVAFGGATGQSELAWFNRRGERLGAVATPAPLHNPVLSADGRTLFGTTIPPDGPGLWTVELDRGVATKMREVGLLPLLSPDGQRLALAAGDGNGKVTIRLQPLDPTDDEDVLFATEQGPIVLTDWSRSSDHVVYEVTSDRSKKDLWVWTRASGVAQAFLESTANEIQGRISPDGRWIAYASDDTGRWEVYVQPFPGGGVKQTVSTNGGADPQWRPDGRELFYLNDARSLVAVEMIPGARLQVRGETKLFSPLVIGEPLTYRSHYAVSADGQRFLVDVAARQDEPISLVLGWQRPR